MYGSSRLSLEKLNTCVAKQNSRVMKQNSRIKSKTVVSKPKLFGILGS